MSPRLDAMIPRLYRLHRSNATTSNLVQIDHSRSNHQEIKLEANERVMNLGLSC